MSFTELLEPILKGGIRSVNFFNGRLLSAEDLKQEQEANREGRARLGQALGSGIAYGLDVALAAGSTSQTPAVAVGAGLALSREGRALKLSSPVDLALVQLPSPDGPSAPGTTFKDCRQVREGVYVSGVGVYLLTLSPAEGSEGRAPFSGLGNTVVTCNTRYRVEGVQFRLLRLLNSTQLGASAGTLRSRVAYECLGAPAARQMGQQPLAGPPAAGYGLLDAKRPAQLSDSEVPLAVVYWSPSGIGFVDQWSVRRPLAARAASERFEPLAGGRRHGEALATLFHFQDHVAAIQADLSIADTANLKADDHLAYLPPAGLLPVGTSAARGFSWQKFLGPHAPPRETQVDEGLLRSIIGRSLLLDPVRVGPFAAGSGYGGTQGPAPYSVYRVPERADFALFARSPQGRLRVFVQPPNALIKTGQVYAEDAERGNLRLNAHVVERSGLYPVANLEAGTYRVSVSAPVFSGSVAGVKVVEGRTTDVLITINRPGNLLVTVKDATTKNPIGHEAQTVTLTREQGGTAPIYAEKATGGQWLFGNVPLGKYRLRVTAEGYVTGEKTVEVTLPEDETRPIEETIELNRVPVTTGLIRMDVRNNVTKLPVDTDVTEVKATSTQPAATYTATRGDDGIWKFVNIPAGVYSLSITAPTYTTGSVSAVTVAAGEVKPVQVFLQPVAGKFVVSVFGADTGRAIDSTGVTVRAVSGTTTFTGTKVGDKWEINDVTPGTYEVRVTAPKYKDAAKAGVAVGNAASVPVEFRMEPQKGTVSLALTWPSGYRVGTFEAVVTPSGQPSLPAVAFNQSDAAVIGNVPAGPVNVKIRDKTQGSDYPVTNFDVVLEAAGTVTRTVGLPSLGVSYTIGESRPLYKPRTYVDWSVDPDHVEAVLTSPWDGMGPSTPARADVKNWLIAWRDWLILTRPNFGLSATATPQVVTRTDSHASDAQFETGRAIFYKTSGGKSGMKLDISSVWDSGL